MNKIFEGKKIKKEGTMPIYVFRCEECGEIFEVFILRSDEEEVIKCPKCGSKKVIKEIASFGILGIGGCGGMRFT